MNLPEDTPLKDAKSLLRQAAVGQGDRCPCCTQFAKVYRRHVTAKAAAALIAVHRLGQDYVHVPSVGRVAQAGGDWAKMEYWGLIEEENAVRPDGGRAGWWRVTDKGRAFILTGLRIPRTAHIYDGRCLRVDGDLTTIQDALGHKFDLAELMSA